MKIANSITELVGKTPLLRLNKISDATGNEIYGKVESFNPLSSIKDRIAKSMIEDSEKRGLLKKGGHIIEPTSGNTGVGLAYIAASKGYKLTLTMPDSMSIERRKILIALGANLVLTPGANGMKGAIDAAEKLVKESPGSFMPSQFTNPANPQAHRENTAVEIFNDTDGKVDILVAGVGTGGTITGTGEALKEKKSSVKVVAVEPQESAVLSGEKAGPHKIQGIGAGFIPEVVNSDIIDEVVKVSSNDAASMARTLAKEEGLLVGISSGAAVVAARKIAKKKENEGKTIIVILPDSGERYLSTWLFE